MLLGRKEGKGLGMMMGMVIVMNLMAGRAVGWCIASRLLIELIKSKLENTVVLCPDSCLSSGLRMDEQSSI